MAFTLVNTEVKRLTRGIPASLGTLSAANQCVTFGVSPCSAPNARYLVITVNGNLSATPYLEFTLDGTNWGAVPALTSDVAIASGADTAAAIAARYNISGLEGAMFRYGLTAYTSGSGAVFATVN